MSSIKGTVFHYVRGLNRIKVENIKKIQTQIQPVIMFKGQLFILTIMIIPFPFYF